VLDVVVEVVVVGIVVVGTVLVVEEVVLDVLPLDTVVVVTIGTVVDVVPPVGGGVTVSAKFPFDPWYPSTTM
jgi:hypothetical protein